MRRSPTAVRDFERARQYGVAGEVLDGKAIMAREPNLTGEFAGAVYFPAPGFVPDPGALAKAYAALFKRKGGRFLVGDARTLQQERRRMAGQRIRGRGGRARGRGGARTMVRSGVSSARIFHPARRQARLPSASGAARQCRAQSSRARFRSRLSAGADEPRHSPYHRRGICPPRRAAEPDPDRAGIATGARIVSAGRGGRRKALEGAGRACPTWCR